MKPKKPIPGAPWCYGERDDHFSGWDCATRVDAIEEALSECEEASTIYLAQHVPISQELPLQTDVDELLADFQEACNLDDSMEDRFHNKEAVADLTTRLAPLFEEIQTTFRRWRKDHQLEIFDFHCEEELTREAAQAEVLANLHTTEKADFALEQISGELQWIEGYLERANSNLKDDALAAISRIRALVTQQEESKKEVSHE